MPQNERALLKMLRITSILFQINNTKEDVEEKPDITNSEGNYCLLTFYRDDS